MSAPRFASILSPRIRALPVIIAYLLLLPCLLAAMGSAEEEGHQSAGSHSPAGSLEMPDIQKADLAKGERLRVVATTSIIGDVASRILGGQADLTVLINAGQSPHSYEATPRDLAEVEKAHLVLVNGLDLEGSLAQAVRAAAKGPVVPVSAGISPILPQEPEPQDAAQADTAHEDETGGQAGRHDHLQGDPHFWMNPLHVIRWTENIAAAASAADPQGAGQYNRRAKEYRQSLTQLDTYIRSRVDQIPSARRIIVTDHHALDYFAREYGLRVIGVVIPGGSDSAAPSPRSIAELIRTIEREQAPALFIGQTAGREVQALARTIRQETGNTISVVPLLTGSLAPRGQAGDTYIDYMRSNTDLIVQALLPEKE